MKMDVLNPMKFTVGFLAFMFGTKSLHKTPIIVKMSLINCGILLILVAGEKFYNITSPSHGSYSSCNPAKLKFTRINRRSKNHACSLVIII